MYTLCAAQRTLRWARRTLLGLSLLRLLAGRRELVRREGVGPEGHRGARAHEVHEAEELAVWHLQIEKIPN